MKKKLEAFLNKKIFSKPYIIIGFIMIMAGCVMFVIQNFHLEETWLLIIIVGFIFFFSGNISYLKVFGMLEMKVRQAKKELHNEEKEIGLRMLVNSLVLDDLGHNIEGTRNFFAEGDIGVERKIYQSTDFMLNELKKNGILTYYSLNDGTTANATNNSKRPYLVTLKKKIEK